jgi:hypothetical protein
MTWFMELNLVGYKFCTLLDYYVVHINHAISRGGTNAMAETNRPHYREFKKYVKAKNMKMEPVDGGAW